MDTAESSSLEGSQRRTESLVWIENEKRGGENESGSQTKTIKTEGGEKSDWKKLPSIRPKNHDSDSRFLDEIISDDTLEIGGIFGQPLYDFISDGELARREKEEKKVKRKRRGLERGRSSEITNVKSTFVHRTHRWAKSLIQNKLNFDTLEAICKVNQMVSSRQPPPISRNQAYPLPYSRKQVLILFCLTLVEVFSYCSMSISPAFFPAEAKKRGLSPTTSGFLLCFFNLSTFLSCPIQRKLLTIVGAHRLFVFGLIIHGMCFLFLGGLSFGNPNFVVLYLITQGLGAAGASAHITAATVYIPKTFPVTANSVFGLMDFTINLGLMVGPLWGGFLHQVGGFGLPFYVLGVLLLFLSPMAYHVLPKFRGRVCMLPSNYFLDLLRPNIIVIELIVVMSATVWSFLEPSLEPHLSTFLVTPDVVGLYFFAFSLAYALFHPIWGIVADLTSNHWILMPTGLILSSMSLLFLGPVFPMFFSNDVWFTLVALILLGISLSLALLPTVPTLLGLIPMNRRYSGLDSTFNIAFPMWSTFYALGDIMGPLIGGYVLEHHGFSTCCTVMAAATFIVGVAAFFFFAFSSGLKKKPAPRIPVKVGRTLQCIR